MHCVDCCLDSQEFKPLPSRSDLVRDVGEAARQGALKMERSMIAGMVRIDIEIHSKKTMPMDMQLAGTEVNSHEQHT